MPGDERPFYLIHQMGKVGSQAIAAALRAHPDVEPWQVQNTHTLNSDTFAEKRWFFGRAGRAMPPELETGLYIRDHVLNGPHPIRIISPFREPVGRNVSSFFHSLDFYLPEHDRGEAIPQTELLAAFYARMRHQVCPKWFWDEILEPFGIDVYATAFPHDRGWQTYRSPRAELIVFPYDLPNVEKATAIGAFLGIQGLTIGTTNEAAERPDAESYAQFTRGARIEDGYLDWMYSTRYARHFFTSEQLDAFRRKWARVTAGARSHQLTNWTVHQLTN